MTPLDAAAMLALVVYAIYRQTQVSEVRAASRFKLALIYGIVGISIGGIGAPHTRAAVLLLVASIALSLALGAARGMLTKVWMKADGRVYRQGTALTVGLFLGLIAAKFAMGTFAYLQHAHDSESFGEIMVMIAVMVAVQAEIVWRRAQSLRASTLEAPVLA
jgi:hypothetical protein